MRGCLLRIMLNSGIEMLQFIIPKLHQDITKERKNLFKLFSLLALVFARQRFSNVLQMKQLAEKLARSARTHHNVRQ